MYIREFGLIKKKLTYNIKNIQTELNTNNLAYMSNESEKKSVLILLKK